MFLEEITRHIEGIVERTIGLSICFLVSWWSREMSFFTYRTFSSARLLSLRLLSGVLVWAICMGDPGCLTAQETQAADETTPADSDDAKLDEAVAQELEEIRESRGLPALWAARYDKDSQPRKFVSGVRKLGSNTKAEFSDLVHLGSCTKAMTGLLFAQLVSNDGSLTWESTLGEALADHPGMEDSDWAGVKVGDILRHRSGFPANAPWQSIHNRIPDDILAARRAVVDWLLKQKPPSKVDFVYSNVNYAVLGHILEVRAGKPWEEIVKERLFKPLGITSAGFGPPGAADGQIDKPDELSQPWGHYVAPGIASSIASLSSLFGGDSRSELTPIRSDNAPPLGPAGRVHMTVDDWAKFLTLFVGEESPKQISGLTDRDWSVLKSSGPAGNYGGGWIIVERGWSGGTALTHSGCNTMWHCTAWIAPERDFFVLAVTNSHSPTAAKAMDEAVSELIRRY